MQYREMIFLRLFLIANTYMCSANTSWNERAVRTRARVFQVRNPAAASD